MGLFGTLGACYLLVPHSDINDTMTSHSMISKNDHTIFKLLHTWKPFRIPNLPSKFYVSAARSVSCLSAHDPLLARDPRRALHIFGPKPAQQHIDYALRYCHLCTPHPSTWGPYTLPGLDAHIGNEEHLLLSVIVLHHIATDNLEPATRYARAPY